MKQKITHLLSFFLLVISTVTYAHNFKKNDKIVFIGNSITHAGSYHNVLRTFLATRYQKDITVLNKGISGDVTDQVLARLEVDILIEKPTVAFVMLGMNDVQRNTYTDTPTAWQLKQQQDALARYKKQTEKLVNLLLDQKIEVILFTPTIFDESPSIQKANNKGVNAALGKCRDHVKSMASKYTLEVVDFYSIMSEVNTDQQAKAPDFTIVGADRIHPGATGHFVMGYQLVNTITKDNREVANLTINAKKEKVTANLNCSIKNLTASNKSVAFQLEENSLPFPIKYFDQKGVALVPFKENLNQETLRIEGLKKGEYTLKIDNQEIGIFTNDAFANGIQLAELATPQLRQAEKIGQLSKEIMRLQNKIRDLRMVDYTIFKIYDSKMTIEERKALATKKLEEYNDMSISWHKYFTKLLKEYVKNIDNEGTMKTDIQNIRQLVFKVAKPIPHNYSIGKVMVQ
ncbi:SGNH/GDSL hydrolase family protein [Flammeovirga pectinis]|nr:SGNH/GDSL hydrolase family protein [Flammeovirga pectinis]